MEYFLGIVVALEALLVVVLHAKLTARNFDAERLKSELRIVKQDLGSARTSPTVDQAQLINLIHQANAMGWKLPATTTSSLSLDEQTQSLLRLAVNPGANDNEARSAAMQVCKRLAKKR